MLLIDAVELEIDIYIIYFSGFLHPSFDFFEITKYSNEVTYNIFTHMYKYSSGLGTSQACGHVDYYPNSGKDQVGCDRSPIEALRLENFDLYNGG